MKSFRKGQGTLEYVIILAAVVGAIILVAVMLRDRIGGNAGMYNTLTGKMQDAANNVNF